MFTDQYAFKCMLHNRWDSLSRQGFTIGLQNNALIRLFILHAFTRWMCLFHQPFKIKVAAFAHSTCMNRLYIQKHYQQVCRCYKTTCGTPLNRPCTSKCSNQDMKLIERATRWKKHHLWLILYHNTTAFSHNYQLNVDLSVYKPINALDWWNLDKNGTKGCCWLFLQSSKWSLGTLKPYF